ncbi:ATP-binding cassette domain-containing protein [Poriferisphaera sp. WC338]|uniref:ATP-binding cassette domain-containing protein n=1 Tax=Poriferisphaera sp. WC338 TaxID=3425129 RepID=UPI003D8197C6
MCEQNHIWTLKDVRMKGRGGCDRLREVNIEIRSGVTVMVGCSGAGKSTLLNVLVGFEQPDAGEVVLHHDLLKGYRHLVYWCPQSGGLWAGVTAGEHVRMVSGIKKKDVRVKDVVRDWLGRFDLEGKEDVHVGQMSGGERARLSLARGLASGCGVLVLDEPLVSVNHADAQRYWEEIHRWRKETGSSVVFSTHFPEVVMREADEIVCMDEGEVLWSGAARDAYDDPVSEQVGRFVGELNWFSQDEGMQWLGAEAGRKLMETGMGVRPERITVKREDTSGLVSRGSVRMGVMVETVIRDIASGLEKRIIHTGDLVEPGARVRLKIKGVIDNDVGIDVKKDAQGSHEAR